MVIIAALILSFTHELLKDKQQKNADIDKMSQILRAINVQTTAEDAEKVYSELITDMYMIDSEGNVIPNSESEAFNANMKAEMSKSEKNRHYPVYIAHWEGTDKYILGLSGAGLWGALWGYIAIESDGNTIYGIDLSHQSETPGLGAEVSHEWFSKEFEGKHLFKNGEFKSVAIVKHGSSVPDRDYVDGISGGTITSHAVSDMLFNTLDGYSKFLRKLNKQ